jgi:hypothetical protein
MNANGLINPDDAIVRLGHLRYSVKLGQENVERDIQAASDSIRADFQSEIGAMNEMVRGLRIELDGLRAELVTERLKQAERRTDDLLALQEAAAQVAKSEAIQAARAARSEPQETCLPVISDWSAGRYALGAIVRALGGVWQSRCSTDAEPGKSGDWQSVVSGISALAIRSTDDIDHELVVTVTDGTEQTLPFSVPSVEYLGIWSEAQQYRKGSAVTDNGSIWIARRSDRLGRPGLPDSGWTLAAKRGAHGRDGKDAPSVAPPKMRYQESFEGIGLAGDLLEHEGELWLCVSQTLELPPPASSGRKAGNGWRLLA